MQPASMEKWGRGEGKNRGTGLRKSDLEEKRVKKVGMVIFQL
jgi:hypothetical protein